MKNSLLKRITSPERETFADTPPSRADPCCPRPSTKTEDKHRVVVRKNCPITEDRDCKRLVVIGLIDGPKWDRHVDLGSPIINKLKRHTFVHEVEVALVRDNSIPISQSCSGQDER